MSTHYATLGLPATASPDAIRQAYRRLVLLTHPDRTPDPAAHQRFLAVNDAYDVLSNPARRAAYDAALRRAAAPAPAPIRTAPPRPDPRRRPAGYRPAPPPMHVRYAAEFNRLLPWLRAVAAFSVVFVGLLFADYATTVRLPNETVQRFDYVARRSRGGGNMSYLVFYTEQARFRTSNSVDLVPGDRVKIQQTRLFGKPKTVRVLSGELRGRRLAVDRFGMLGVFGAAVLLSAPGVLLRRLRADDAFSFGFVNCVALGLLLAFYVFY